MVGPSIEAKRLQRPSVVLRKEKGWPAGTVVVDGIRPAIPSDHTQRAEVEADERHEVEVVKRKRREERRRVRLARKRKR